MINAAKARAGQRWAGLTPLLAVLLLTAATILLWGHFRPLDQDEVFVLQTDSVPTVRALVDVQRHTPISLDPLFYHLLGHGAVSLFGADAFAIRLPSLIGYLLMQVCLFLVAKRFGGPRAGFVAAAVPALTATLFYGVQARPYGVLLGLGAATLLGWQRAVCHRSSKGRPPMGALLLLAGALALALNTHYFAILLLIPLYAAELVRTFERVRRHLPFDWRVWLAIAAGTLAEAFTLPFQKGAGEFRNHYYNAGYVGLHAVTQSYRALFINYTTYPAAVQLLLECVLVVFALGLLCLLWRRWVGRGLFRRADTVSSAERIYLLVLAAMPVFGFLLARFVTHSIEVRYVLSAMLGIAVLIAIAARPLLATRRGFAGTATVLLLAILASGAERVLEERRHRDALLQALRVSPQLQARLLANPAARIYVQNLGFFEETMPLLPSAMRSRMVLLYSGEQEIRWLRHDTAALTVLHMQHFTSVPTQSYEDLRHQPGEHLMLLHPDGWEWLGRAFTEEHADVRDTGLLLGGHIVAVRFLAKPAGVPER